MKFDISETQSDIKLNVNGEHDNKPQEPLQKYGYAPILNKYRNDIDNINPEHWKKVRWYINDYDFLVKDPIINRAFYKYWEVLNEFELFDKYKDKNLILHCAEAPGGFIQGTNIYLQIDRIVEEKPSRSIPSADDDGFVIVQKKKRRPKNDYRIYTISLNKDLPQYKAYNLPSYNKNILNKHVCITYGKDNTGDINNWDNIKHISKLAKDAFYLITADGGFDEGTDFNNKEQLHYCLILSEIYAAISLQQSGGHFVLKVFDVFTETSAHLLYLLTQCYEEVYSYKPKTSRPTNSEKYIICKGFRTSDEAKQIIMKELQKLFAMINGAKSKYVTFKIFDSLPDSFVANVKHMNDMLLQTQCDSLSVAVSLCSDSGFIKEYDDKLIESIEQRKRIFHQWETYYNLNSYV